MLDNCWRSLLLALLIVSSAGAAPPHPYRLSSVSLKPPLLWGFECPEPAETGLAFGGMDQEADGDFGRGHTRRLIAGQWQRIDEALRRQNAMQPQHVALLAAAREAHALLAVLRNIYFQGQDDLLQQRLVAQTQPDRKRLEDQARSILASMERAPAQDYEKTQFARAAVLCRQALAVTTQDPSPLSADSLRRWSELPLWFDRAATCCAAEPPPRAMDCGRPSLKDYAGPVARPLVYDPHSKLYVLFGGDHLDYLTNDTWVFDPARNRWFQRNPGQAPAPRANHRLTVLPQGKIQLTGGYTYTSSIEYLSGQYVDLDDGEFIYDIAADKWSGGKLVRDDARTYRTGALHPDHFLQGPRPNAAEFESFLRKLPANRWVATDPPYKPELNRDWGCARIDPARDLLLRWSGGHSAHGGTDVPHFHFATNRWELAFPVEFPLGQLYANTEYPRGLNFNGRPWMTGHTYQNYEFDPPSGLLVQTGEERHFNLYDPQRADWIGRGAKPEAMSYDSSFYTLTLIATPHGAICWGGNGRVHRFAAREKRFVELQLSGDKLPGANVDYATIAYDSKRDRLLCFNAPGYGKDYQGGLWEVDLKSNRVKQLPAAGFEMCPNFSHIDRCCYVPTADLVVIAAYLKHSGDWTRTPAFDCSQSRWVTLDVKYDVARRSSERVDRAFPHNRSCGLVWDPKRELLWGTDTRGQIYVLRLDVAQADVQLGQ